MATFHWSFIHLDKHLKLRCHSLSLPPAHISDKMSALANIVCLLSLIWTCSSCPAPFTVTAGFCVYKSSEMKTWCDAQVKCREIGGQLVQGNEKVAAIGSVMSPSYAWIGATDMQHEQRTSRQGWRWSNGSELSESFSWIGGDPGDTPNQDCLFIKENLRIG